MTRFKIPLALALLFLVYLPFLNQAFHIDDPYYLKAAEQIVKDPLRPYQFECNWDGVTRPYRLIATNPPLHSYFLAAVMATGVRGEWAYHLGMFLFVALAFYGAYALGARFGVDPLLAALLVTATPAVQVMSHTCMADLPFMAFYLLALAAFIRAVDWGEARWFFAAGAAAAAASLIKYSAVTLLPLFLLYAWLNRAKGVNRAGLAWALLLPPAAIAGWLAADWAAQGALHIERVQSIMQATGALQLAGLFSKASVVQYGALLAYIGAATVFPAGFFLAYPWNDRTSRLAALFAFSAALLLWTALQPAMGPGLHGALFLAAVWAALLFLLGPALRGLFGPKDPLFLSAWFFLLLLSSPLLHFSAVRRLLPALPPLVFLLLRDWRAPKAALYSLLAATLALGLLVSWADYRQAGEYRRFARETAPAYRSAEKRTLFAGQWGFLHYMEEQGFSPLDVRSDKLEPGDRVIIARQPWPQWNKRVPPESVALLPPGPAPLLPLRTLGPFAKVNFYSVANFPGLAALLPYGFSKEPLELFILHTVPEGQQ